VAAVPVPELVEARRRSSASSKALGSDDGKETETPFDKEEGLAIVGPGGGTATTVAVATFGGGGAMVGQLEYEI